MLNVKMSYANSKNHTIKVLVAYLLVIDSKNSFLANINSEIFK